MVDINMAQDREKIELYVSCRSLKNMDIMSKSDPQVIFFQKNNTSNQWNELGRTELIKNNLNPNFCKTFRIDFIFEMQQHIKFNVIDIDGPSSYDFIGEVQTTVGKIVGSRNQVCILDILDKSGSKSGKLIVRAEKIGDNREILYTKISCRKLKDLHFFSKTSPFLQFSKSTEDNSQLKIYQTEHYSNNLNPVFKPFELKVEKICNGDYLRPIKVDVFDYEESGNHKHVGQTTFTLQDIVKQNKKNFQFISKSNKPAGELIFDQVSIIIKPEFIDYLRGGTQISLITAVDFTGSNGHPSAPSSLHAINQNGQLNQYQQAIVGVGEILLNYDYDKMVPVFGFGGKPKLPNFSFNQALHCFPLNGNPNNPEVYGLEGIMQSYLNLLLHVELAGPTLFNPIITEAVKVAAENKKNNIDVYTVLLILTDGAINDMSETISTIVAAAYYPISLIIIGVGNGDFGAMETLDGDNGLMDNHGNRCKRDLVQFVPFNRFKNNAMGLAADVLAELPTQLVEYNRLIGKSPNPPQMVDMANMQIQPSVYPGQGQPQQPPQYGQPLPGGLPQNPAINKQFNSMMSHPYQNPIGFQPQPQFAQPNPGSPLQGSPQNPAFFKQLNPMMSQPYPPNQSPVGYQGQAPNFDKSFNTMMSQPQNFNQPGPQGFNQMGGAPAFGAFQQPGGGQNFNNH